MFRFEKNHIPQLLYHLNFPPLCTLENGSRLTGEKVLLLLLFRFHYPIPLFVMSMCFNINYSIISRAVLYGTNHIYSQFRTKLDFDFNLVNGRIHEYVAAVTAKSSGAVQNVWGFIDGTARPSRDQREYFSGHKKQHGLRYQMITTADGMIVHMWGPIGGRWPDSTIVRDSGILDILRVHYDAFCVWGDAGYALCRWILRPFLRRAANEEQRAWQAEVNKCRISVDWNFGLIATNFPALKQQQKVLMSPIARHYLVAAVLTNCLTCLKGGNQASMYFDMRPPTLEEYCSDLEPV
ncbi:unnamed protein product, partial [Heterosigma akashiwo]